MLRGWPAVIPFLVLLALAACGGEDLLLPSSGQPARITAVSGSGQNGTVGQALAQPFVVEVTDPEGRPVAGVEVAFVGPTGAGLAPNDTVLTGPDGRASVQYTLATSSGDQAIEARARPVVPSPSLTTTFHAIAAPEAAVELIAMGGNLQQGEVQTALADSLAVQAIDPFGNGVEGIEVTWHATDGSVNPQSVVTGADGRAATQRTLGTKPGVYRTTAAADLEGSPVAFEATGVAPPSPQLVLLTQPSSEASAGVPFAQQPVLQLQDASGTPLARADVAVTVQITEGSPSLGGTTTARSDASGLVSFTDLSIQGRPGDRMLLFAAVDFTPATSAAIDVNPGPPAASRSSASVPNKGTAGQTSTMSIRLEDQFGTDVEGAAGAVAVTIDGANPGSVTVTEQGGGSYSAAYTPTVTGTDLVNVRVRGTSLDDSPFSSQVEPGPAAASTTTAQVTKAGGFFFEITILVTTRDALGNPRGRGGEQVLIQFEGNDATREAHDNGDGTYSDQFITIAFNPSIIILLNGVPIAGSPYRP